MDRDILSQVAAFLLEKRRTARWRKVVSVLAMVVVFCTTYALILPAITMEREPDLRIRGFCATYA